MKINPKNMCVMDNLELLKAWPSDWFTACVTDPPYGLAFMNKKWDYDVPGVDIWKEVLRVLKPGGWLVCFAGTRTQHRMAVNIEDAGFEIRDMIAWVYGSGFPKSMDISKAIDKKAGVERDAQKWNGYGTALKPALEPITLARKPLDGTNAENVLKWGCGGLWIDGGRVETQGEIMSYSISKKIGVTPFSTGTCIQNEKGRFPANLIHDGSEEVLGGFPETKSGAKLPHHVNRESENNCMSGKNYARTGMNFPASSGSASRFFYCVKASKAERNVGLDRLPIQVGAGSLNMRSDNHSQKNGMDTKARNIHPTVKPLALMRYLVRLVRQPSDNNIIDPYAGTGTTGIACEYEGIDKYMLIENSPEYAQIAFERDV